ncbi:MAG TPA: hypothetical protein VF638_14205 [Sphingomonas sp.]|jgi:hypothetical protein
MNVEQFRAYAKAQPYRPSMKRWCEVHNVNRPAAIEFMAGKRPGVPFDLAHALGFERGVVPHKNKESK